MSVFAPVRCPTCNKVVFRLLHGIGDGKCCGKTIMAERKLDTPARIISVGKPERVLIESR